MLTAGFLPRWAIAILDGAYAFLTERVTVKLLR